MEINNSEYRDGPIDELLGELPPLSESEMDMIVKDLEASNHKDEAHQLLDFWQDSIKNREERIRRYLGHMGM